MPWTSRERHAFLGLRIAYCCIRARRLGGKEQEGPHGLHIGRLYTRNVLYFPAMSRMKFRCSCTVLWLMLALHAFPPHCVLSKCRRDKCSDHLHAPYPPDTRTSRTPGHLLATMACTFPLIWISQGPKDFSLFCYFLSLSGTCKIHGTWRGSLRDETLGNGARQNTAIVVTRKATAPVCRPSRHDFRSIQFPCTFSIKTNL